MDRAIWHTVVHHSSTRTYVPNFTEIGRKIFFQVQCHVIQKPEQTSKMRPDQI